MSVDAAQPVSSITDPRDGPVHHLSPPESGSDRAFSFSLRPGTERIPWGGLVQWVPSTIRRQRKPQRT
jgi:hypothetical protein